VDHGHEAYLTQYLNWRMNIWSIDVSDWRVRLLVCVAGIVTQTRLEEVCSNLGHSVRWRCASWRDGRLGLSERDLGVESALHGRSKASSVVQSGKGRAEGFDMILNSNLFAESRFLTHNLPIKNLRTCEGRVQQH